MPRRLRLLLITTGVMGATCVGGAAVAAVADPPPMWLMVAALALFVALSRIVPLQLRLGSNTVAIDWAEAALVYGLVELGLPWVVLATLAGAAAIFWLRLDRIKASYNIAAAVIATALACVALAAVSDTRPDPLSVSGAAVLILAAAVYTVAADIFTGLAVGFSRSVGVLEVFADGIGMKAVSFAGNVMVAFGLFAVAEVNAYLLAIVPPAVWLLHQGYAGRVRARTERRTWQELAAATHALNTLNARMVEEAAVVGAARVFAADVVEVEFTNSQGVATAVRGNAAGEVTRGALPVARPEPVILEAALRGGADETLGVLRLCFRSDVRLGERERLALSTFADSLAAALRNAEIHEQLQSLAKRKAFEAEHDLLTGLSSRRHLIEAGGRALVAGPPSADRPAVYALLLIDLDHFKEVNDTLGHDAGDELLVKAAHRLVEAKRADEVLARLGGDEFAVLVPAPEGASVELAVDFAKKRAAALLAAIGEPIHLGQIWLTVEASVGVAVTVRGGCDVAELLRRADIAMYQAKRSPQAVMNYNPVKDASSLDRLALLTEMQTALDEGGQLVLNLQPTIDLASGAPLGAEALIRWQHPRRGLLKPADFIEQIEQTDLIGPLTSQILDLALAACVSWEVGGVELPVAVNLSARSLLDRELPRRVSEMLDKHGMPAERLVLEITETAMMSELEIVEEVVDQIRELGVQLSLDDFGTGYSSLTFLARVKVDEVKIDQGFVAKMHESPEAEAIVRTTIELARSLGLRVIAEGVENADQRAALAQLGCTGAQGYHLYPPMAPDEARAAIFVAAQSAASHSSATVIPLGPKRAPWLGRRTATDDDPDGGLEADGDSASELD
jgi:diguanylate cyclase (GGDEF)-like protein